MNSDCPTDHVVARRVRAAIRDIPDFPIPGILFRDITPLLADVESFRLATEAMAGSFEGRGITHVAAVESRGFLFGAPVAQRLGAALVPVRKLGKLPHRTRQVEYALEYGAAALEVHEDAWGAGHRVLVVDDVLATGGTAAAVCDLAEGMGATVAGLSFLLELGGLGGPERLGARIVRSVVRY